VEIAVTAGEAPSVGESPRGGEFSAVGFALALVAHREGQAERTGLERAEVRVDIVERREIEMHAAVRLEAVKSLLAIGPPKATNPEEYKKEIKPYLDSVEKRLAHEKGKGGDKTMYVWLLLLQIMYDDRVLADLPMAWVGDHLFSFAQWLVTGFTINCPESAAPSGIWSEAKSSASRGPASTSGSESRSSRWSSGFRSSSPST